MNESIEPNKNRYEQNELQFQPERANAFPHQSNVKCQKTKCMCNAFPHWAKNQKHWQTHTHTQPYIYLYRDLETEKLDRKSSGLICSQ